MDDYRRFHNLNPVKSPQIGYHNEATSYTFFDNFPHHMHSLKQLWQQFQPLDTAQCDKGCRIGENDHSSAVSRARSSAVSSSKVALASKAKRRNATRSIPSQLAAMPEEILPSLNKLMAACLFRYSANPSALRCRLKSNSDGQSM